MTKVLGITDEVNECSCCGRTDLKSTVLVEFDDGSDNHFGSTCASRALGWSKDETSRAINQAKREMHEREMIWRDAAHQQYLKDGVIAGTHCECGVGLKYHHDACEHRPGLDD